MHAVRPLVCLLLIALDATSAGATEREINRTFPVRMPCTLALDSYRGSVEINEGDAPEIRVALVIDTEANTEDAAARLLDDIVVDFTPQENGVAIRARNRRDAGVHLALKNDDARADLIYRLTVPRNCSVDLRARTGSFAVGNLIGRMSARLENGPISFRRIDGTIEAHTETGDIVVSRCSGAVTARVSRGTIRVGTIGGVADLKNTNGDIDVMAARAGLSASTEVGDVLVGFAPPLSAESRVTVSAGNIIANVHPETSCRIEAASTWGHVTSNVPLKIESGASGGRSLRGQLNGGGPLIHLRASGGSIKIGSDVVVLESQ